MKTQKFKYVSAHLAVSVFVAICAAYIVFMFWYPYPLNTAVGVTHIFLMMLGIDMVLGPFFSWLVYKEGKKTLKFDLTIIVLIQVLALGYGMYQIMDGRPAWLVFNVDRFELVKNNEIVIQNKNQVSKEFRQPSYLQPSFTATEFAKDAKIRTEDMMIELADGISIAQRPERYIPLAKASKDIAKKAQPLLNLNDFNPHQQVEQVLKQYPQAKSYLPMSASVLDMTVLLDDQAKVIKIVNLRPWD